jgi:hypothetical protein
LKSGICPGNARFVKLLSYISYVNLQEPDSLTKDAAQNERHSYEKCQYEEFKKRMAKMDELRAAKGGARSN